MPHTFFRISRSPITGSYAVTCLGKFSKEKARPAFMPTDKKFDSFKVSADFTVDPCQLLTTEIKYSLLNQQHQVVCRVDAKGNVEAWIEGNSKSALSI